jgi:hypothetical protein
VRRFGDSARASLLELAHALVVRGITIRPVVTDTGRPLDLPHLRPEGE